ncbi:hypothetical protein J6590_064564 [Homalodisca vitripennis]|nr:hypothetical protein J6590_064564 [Homalodisca vitripennis]
MSDASEHRTVQHVIDNKERPAQICHGVSRTDCSTHGDFFYSTTKRNVRPRHMGQSPRRLELARSGICLLTAGQGRGNKLCINTGCEGLRAEPLLANIQYFTC